MFNGAGNWHTQGVQNLKRKKILIKTILKLECHIFSIIFHRLWCLLSLISLPNLTNSYRYLSYLHILMRNAEADVGRRPNRGHAWAQQKENYPNSKVPKKLEKSTNPALVRNTLAMRFTSLISIPSTSLGSRTLNIAHGEVINASAPGNQVSVRDRPLIHNGRL
uniref:Uncharacterized protein n=1 Tax=Cacopsylla melanoneura TaxID=428564 RepID=A0A8D8RG76_9HEMI